MSESHPKVIFHIDIDYFYAQVEEVLNPELRNKPFGVQQGLNVVTCNYIAREFGIKKWTTVKECLQKCPDLVLVNGEDLSNYKKFSVKISDFINEALGPTERMGLDEHTVDITKHVEDRLNTMTEKEKEEISFVGPFYPSEDAFECECGCMTRLIVGSHIAEEIRKKVFEELKITCSAGIAHNKLLAKLCGGLNKPNNQTTLAPLAAAQFMLDLEDLRKITGIGGKTAQRINELGIKTIKELQEYPIEKLRKVFSTETANRLKEVSFGIDMSEVKPSGKPKTVGLEHSCVPTLSRVDAREKFVDLLNRLIERIEDDVRLPQSMRVTLRKYDTSKKISVKETKHFQIPSPSFKFVNYKICFIEGADEKILKEIMKLFDIMMEKETNSINLFGLTFCKFQEVAKGANSIENFFKKRDEEQPAAKRVKLDVNENSEMNTNTLESQIPQNIDRAVWSELPHEIQQELYKSWQSSKTKSTVATKKRSSNSRSKADTILKYVIKKQ